MMQSSPVLSLSPSFTCYSSSRLAQIAARVVEEFRDQDELDESFTSLSAHVNVHQDENGFQEETKNENVERIEKVEDGSNDGQGEVEADEEFEFAFVAKDFVPSPLPTPADEIFYNGQIRPIYPLFDTNLLDDAVEMRKENHYLDYYKSKPKPKPKPPPFPITESIRLPLRKLFIEEREPPSSCSSSEADELEGITPGTYCVWNPKAAAAPEKHCEKSNSTGSSKRWRFRDLLHRSSSDGKDKYVFLNHPNSHNSNGGRKREEKAERFDRNGVTSAQGGERRRASFLPYRQDLVGIFTNANGLSRNLHPF